MKIFWKFVLLFQALAGLKTRPVPDHLKVAKAVIIGCKHCSLTLPEFVDKELALFHNVRFEEQNGLQKIVIRFRNDLDHKLAEVDVTKVELVK